MTEGFKRDADSWTLEELRFELYKLVGDNKRQKQWLEEAKSRGNVVNHSHNIEINNERIEYILMRIAKEESKNE